MKRSEFFPSLNNSTLRVAASYLAIIMTLSIGFSFAFYHDSTRALGRQLPAPVDLGSPDYGYVFGLDRPGVNKFLSERFNEGRDDLLHRLILLNLLALIGGGGLSYFLARRSLAPIEASMAAQSRFVSDASHELRTPLTAIRTQNEVSLRKKSIGTKEAKEIINSNLSEIKKLENLTEGLLSLAKNDQIAAPLTSVALGEAAAQAINNVINRAQAKQIIIKDQTGKEKAWAAPTELVRAITAMLDNAVKYSQPQTEINVTSRTAGDYVELDISDQGQGILASDLPHIFERFYRVDSSRTHNETAGYGLGLSIAKKIIVEQFGGQINVSSVPGEGSTFSIRLPIKHPFL